MSIKSVPIQKEKTQYGVFYVKKVYLTKTKKWVRITAKDKKLTNIFSIDLLNSRLEPVKGLKINKKLDSKTILKLLKTFKTLFIIPV